MDPLQDTRHMTQLTQQRAATAFAVIACSDLVKCSETKSKSRAGLNEVSQRAVNADLKP